MKKTVINLGLLILIGFGASNVMAEEVPLKIDSEVGARLGL